MVQPVGCPWRDQREKVWRQANENGARVEKTRKPGANFSHRKEIAECRHPIASAGRLLLDGLGGQTGGVVVVPFKPSKPGGGQLSESALRVAVE
jgi:hypothetical protein